MASSGVKLDVTIIFNCTLIVGFLTCWFVFFIVFYLGVIKGKGIYLISTGHILMDIMMISCFLFYLIPISYASDYIFPGGRFGTCGQISVMGVLWSWFYITISQMVMAFNRLIVLCYPRLEIFTYRNNAIVTLALFPICFALSFSAQFLIPCCPIAFNHHLMSYVYVTQENVTNYANLFINSPLNMSSSAIALICYALIFLFLKRSSKLIVMAQGSRKKSRREIVYALQFCAISLFHFLEWTSFRILPLFVNMKSPDFNPLFTIVGFSVTINASMNSIVYLICNKEVHAVILQQILGRSSGVISAVSVTPSSKISKTS